MITSARIARSAGGSGGSRRAASFGTLAALVLAPVLVGGCLDLSTNPHEQQDGDDGDDEIHGESPAMAHSSGTAAPPIRFG